ncbi:MAG: hypothetical protein LBR62_02575 [Puniceicoccales bacterium]|jgi:hypothetical protein|nr:hypothetical protein [Puniceicoccales bacterium]
MAPSFLKGDELDDLIRDAKADFVSLFTPEEQAVQNYSALSEREKATLDPIVVQAGANMGMKISLIQYKVRHKLINSPALSLSKLSQASVYLSSRYEFMFYSCAQRYFKGLFGAELVPVVVEVGEGESSEASHIYFWPKSGGVQFGRRIVVTGPADGSGRFPACTYHAKTHQHGMLDPSSTSGKSSLVQSIEWGEVFVYKFLELIGMGSEVHFFGLDAKNFYIATRDVNEETMLRIPESKDEEEGGEGSKKLFLLKRDKVELLPTLNPTQYPKELVKIDILVRILGLTDALSNPGNVFFLVDKGGLVGSHIIDFHLVRKDDPGLYSVNIFSSFEKGNSSSQYNKCSPIMQDILVRNPAKRIQTAMEVMTPEWIAKLNEAMMKAQVEVEAMIPHFSAIPSASSSSSPSSSPSGSSSGSSSVDDFNGYIEFVKKNLSNFCGELQTYLASGGEKKAETEEDEDH